jgi:hemoglobin
MKQQASIALTCSLLLALSACGSGGDESRLPSSGNPEADRRADLRVGAEDDKGNKEGKTLYDRIGGTPMITAIVDDMTTRVLADPRVNFERKNVKVNWIGSKYDSWEPNAENVARFKTRMVQFLTLAAGGPVNYEGRDMQEAHKGMRITNDEFDAMVGDIKTSMDKLNIPQREKRDMLAVVETTRKQIVEQ